LWKIRGILSLLLFSSIIHSGVSGYLFLSALDGKFLGKRELALFSSLRLNFHWELGGAKIKLSPQFNAAASSPLYSSFLIGGEPEEVHSLFLHKDDYSSVYLFLDRASLSIEKGRFSITLGRDRYPWGKARIFSLLDIFNPYNPFSLSPQRLGADGGRLRFYLSDFSWLEGIWIKREGKGIYGAGLFFSWGGFDFQLSTGEARGKFLGFAFEGDIAGVGVRGEIFKKQEFGLEYVLGADWQINPKTYIMGEYLKSQGSLYPPVKTLLLGISRQITPLLTAELHLLGFSPSGRAFWGGLHYSATENLDIKIGVFYASSSPWPLPQMNFLSWKLYF